MPPPFPSSLSLPPPSPGSRVAVFVMRDRFVRKKREEKKADVCLNLYPCVIKDYLISLSVYLSVCLSVCLSDPPPPLPPPPVSHTLLLERILWQRISGNIHHAYVPMKTLNCHHHQTPTQPGFNMPVEQMPHASTEQFGMVPARPLLVLYPFFLWSKLPPPPPPPPPLPLLPAQDYVILFTESLKLNTPVVPLMRRNKEPFWPMLKFYGHLPPLPPPPPRDYNRYVYRLAQTEQTCDAAVAHRQGTVWAADEVSWSFTFSSSSSSSSSS